MPKDAQKTLNCKTHQCIPYNAESEQIIDVNYYCQSYSDEVMNLYCPQCKKSSVSTHYSKHMSESIVTTIASLSKQVKNSLKIMENHISELHDENANLKKQVDLVEHEYSDQVDECKTTKKELVL